MITLIADEICQVLMSNGKPCGRRKYKDNKKCILHLENKSDEEAKIFEIVFWEELNKMEKDNDIKELDFKDFIFNNSINFDGHFFEKSVIFEGAQFNNKVSFIHAKFNNDAAFSSAKFDNEVSFWGTQFNNIVYFLDTKFNNVTSFVGAQFNNEADFLHAEFNNRADFLRAQFNNKVCFDIAKFNNEAVFQSTKFNNKAYFSGTEFNNIASFELSEFQDEVFFYCIKFSSSGKGIIYLNNVKFLDPKHTIFQNIDLSNVSFLNTDVTEVEFLDEKWARKNGRLAVVDETNIGRYGSTTYGAVAQLYRRLRRNYEINYRFAEAGEFFIGEMEMRRRDVNTSVKSERIRNIVLRLKRNFSLLGLYKLLSLYGESYKLPIIWAFIVIVSYPILMNWLFNVSLPQSDDFLYTYLRTSASSFFQMDSTYSAYIGERILGFLIIGLLFIALKRKFERKK